MADAMEVDATEKSDAAAGVKTPAQSARNPRKRNRPGRGAVQKRGDNYRLQKSNEFLNSENSTRGRAALDKKWLSVGLTEITAAKPVVSKSTTWVPISLRGVGATVALCYSRLFSLHPQKVERLCTIYQAYRASLAQVTLRLSNEQLMRPASAIIRPDQTDVFMTPEIATLVSSNAKGLSPIASLASGLGWFEHQGKMYQTYLPPVLANGQLTGQTAYRVTALNLNQIAGLLEAPGTPRAHAAFVERNPLPGARFNARNRLDNAQEICPDGWPNRIALQQDFDAFNALLEFAESKAPGLVGTMSYEHSTAPISLVSRYIRDDPGAVVTVPGARDSYQFLIPYEETWHMPEPVDDQLILRGVLSLLGETEADRGIRARVIASGSTVLDWRTIMDSVRNRQ